MNRFTRQRVLSLLMVGSLMVGSMPSVLALDGYTGVKDIPGVGNSEVTLTVENTGGSGGGDTPVDPDNPDVPPVDPVIFSAYVPAELPIKMDLDGNVVVPDNAMIINAVETKGICVTDIGVTMENDWLAAGWSEDFSSKADNTKELGLKLRDDTLQTDGTFPLTSDNWKIPKNSFIDLNMGAKLPKQTEAGSKGKIATISFTLDWSGDDVSVGPEIPGGNPNGGGGSSGGGSETPDVPADISTLNVDWENGLLLPGSKKTATFNWDSTNQNDKIVNLVSSNKAIAVVPDLGSIPTPMSETNSYKGSLPVEVTAVARGTSTITATLESGATTTFDVQVSEIDTNIGSEPSGEVKPDSSFNEGDTLNPDDITVTIPVVKPDGSTEDIVVTPDTVPDTPLDEGENNIEITVDINGVKVIINIVINIASSNPSNGMVQSVAEAQAMGFAFAPYNDGLEITGFENKQFKSEINIPENIGDFKVLKVGNSVFNGQTNLKKITMPDTVEAIGSSTFKGCAALVEMNLPMAIEVIPESAFSGCVNLENVSMSENIKSIGNSAFLNCKHLISYMNLNNVEMIGSSAFNGCEVVTLGISTKKLMTIGAGSFDNTKEVKVEIEDISYKQMNADLLSTFSTAIPLGSRITLYDEKNEEVIPAETIYNNCLYQDFNYDFVKMQGNTLNAVTGNDIYLPEYANGIKKGAIDILRTLKIAANTKVHIGADMVINQDSQSGTPVYPAEIYINSNYNEYKYKNDACLYSSMVHYKDRSMMFGKDVTGYTLNRAYPEDFENMVSYKDGSSFTIKNITNLNSVKFYFTNIKSASIRINASSTEWVEVPYKNGFNVVKNCSTATNVFASNYAIFYYMDDTNKIISSSNYVCLGWNYAKNGLILNDIVIPA